MHWSTVHRARDRVKLNRARRKNGKSRKKKKKYVCSRVVRNENGNRNGPHCWKIRWKVDISESRVKSLSSTQPLQICCGLGWCCAITFKSWVWGEHLWVDICPAIRVKHTLHRKIIVEHLSRNFFLSSSSFYHFHWPFPPFKWCRGRFQFSKGKRSLKVSFPTTRVFFLSLGQENGSTVSVPVIKNGELFTILAFLDSNHAATYSCMVGANTWSRWKAHAAWRESDL